MWHQKNIGSDVKYGKQTLNEKRCAKMCENESIVLDVEDAATAEVIEKSAADNEVASATNKGPLFDYDNSPGIKDNPQVNSTAKLYQGPSL
jgi:hypothetical protein